MRTFSLYLPLSWIDVQGNRHYFDELQVDVSDDGEVRESRGKSLHQRSRERHDPGSGPYTNRWVFSNENVYVNSNGKEYPGYVRTSDYYSTAMDMVTSLLEWNGTGKFAGGVYYHPGNGRFLVSTLYVKWQPLTLPTVLNSWKYVESKQRSVSQWFNTKEDAFAIYEQERAYYAMPFSSNIGRYSKSNYYLRLVELIEKPGTLPRFSDDPAYYADQIDLGIDGPGKTANALVAQAYVNAVDSLPDLSGMGNAVNALQLIDAGLGILKAILSRNLIKGLKSVPSASRLAKDAWLAYRYSYGTTKADLMEVSSYLGRAADLLFTDRVRSNGSASLKLSDTDEVLARCSIVLGVSALKGLKSTIERYGLQLDGYAMWDLVPYSFVVDWFLDVGGQLEYARKRNFARRVKNQACWCSFERRWVNEYGFEEIYYHRWQGQPDVSAAPYAVHCASKVTIVKRAIDALALLR